jgi:hypothetical protein
MVLRWFLIVLIPLDQGFSNFSKSLKQVNCSVVSEAIYFPKVVIVFIRQTLESWKCKLMLNCTYSCCRHFYFQFLFGAVRFPHSY